MTSFPLSTDPTPRGWWWASLIALCAALLLPLTLIEVPPLLDYPNHLARLFVLAFGADDPDLSRFYASHWTIIPNLGIDLIGPPLLGLLPVHVAGRVLLGVVILLPVLGTIAYSRAVTGQRSWWALGCGLVAYNQTVLLGFVNFAAATGLALLLAAAWLRWRDERPLATLAGAALGCVGLFFCHLMGVILFGVLISGHELIRLWQVRAAGERAILRRLAAGAAVFVAPAVLYVVSPLKRENAEPLFRPMAEKARQLLAPFAGYDLALDTMAALLTLMMLLMLARMRHLRVPAAAGIALALSLVLFIAAPFGAKGTFHLDTRFIVLAGFLLFGGLLPRPLPRGGGVLLAAVIVGLFGARMTVLSLAWVEQAGELRAVRRVMAAIPRGSAVYLAVAPPDRTATAPPLSTGQRTDVHLAALLPIERRAWWPFLFDNESQQPVTTRPPYRDLARRVGGVPQVRNGTLPAGTDLRGFDHVLVIGATGGLDPVRFGAGRLDRLSVTPRAAAFRVRPGSVPDGVAEEPVEAYRALPPLSSEGPSHDLVDRRP